MQPSKQSTNLAEYLDFDAVTYLSQYWPQFPSDSIAWYDNVALMHAYQDSALEIRKLFAGHTGLNLLDIGTGPALAPLLAIISEVKSAQLSDFHQQNREAIFRLPVDYWSNYVPLLTTVFADPQSKQQEILNKLDGLRKQHPVLPVDLFASDPFSGKVKSPENFQLVTMNFVADGITSSPEAYFHVLDRVLNLVADGSVLSMSAIIDSDFWCLGEVKHPSPKLSEKQVVNHLEDAGLEICQLTRSSHVHGQTYDGSWVVLTAKRNRG